MFRDLSKFESKKFPNAQCLFFAICSPQTGAMISITYLTPRAFFMSTVKMHKKLSRTKGKLAFSQNYVNIKIETPSKNQQHRYTIWPWYRLQKNKKQMQI